MLAWVAVAAVVTWPVVAVPSVRLVGDPRIDVWNHAWGYHWVATTLAQGALPWFTTAVGGPDGGVLYFIDLWGALWATPLTLLFGPAVGYNAVMVGRVALAGIGGELLAEQLTGRGSHTILAGVGCATAPFLLAELNNGISEVAGIGWVCLALWGCARALERDRPRDYALAGLLAGAAAAVSFYYGLVVAALVATAALASAGRAWQGGASLRSRATRLLVLAAPAAAVGLPPWLLFGASLAHPTALIRRPPALDIALLDHNAVDPRIFVTPGSFVSVDLAAVYGEPFVHTGYLRWTVLALAALGVVAALRAGRRGLAGWAGLAALSVGMGLGNQLFWAGDWVTVGGWRLTLPFGLLRAVLPQVAITHPLRLSVGAQVLLPALAAAGGAVVARKVGRWAVPALAVLIAAEGLLGSAATWPLATSNAAVPALYRNAPAGMVLDLPVEAGTGMQTSRWFWFQTVHGRPVPWTPDVRLGSARDSALLRILGDPRGGGPATEAPHPLDAAAQAHLKRHYGLIVLHTEVAPAPLAEAYTHALTAAFGPPELDGPRRIWRP